MLCNLFRHRFRLWAALRIPVLFTLGLCVSVSAADEKMVELLVSSTGWPSGSAVMRYDARTGAYRGQLDDPDADPDGNQYVLPEGLAVDPENQVYVAYRCSTCDKQKMGAILKFSLDTGGRFLGPPPFASGEGETEGFEGLAISPDGLVLYTGQREFGQIYQYEIKSSDLLNKLPDFSYLRGLTFDRAGILYVLAQSDKFAGAGQIFGITAGGRRFLFVEPDPNGPLQLDASSAGLTFGPDGDLYVVSTGPDKVLLYRVEHRFQPPRAVFQGEFATPANDGCVDPVGVAFGPHDQNLYVTCRTSNNVVRYEGRTGRFLGEFVRRGDSSRLSSPTYVSFASYDLPSSLRLLSPPNGEQTEPVTVFRWTRSDNPAVHSYRLIIATDQNMDKVVLNLPKSGSERIVAPQVTVRLNTELDDLSGRILYWRVIAQHGSESKEFADDILYGRAGVQEGSVDPDEQSQEIFSCFFYKDLREFTEIRGTVISNLNHANLVGARVAVCSERHAQTIDSSAETVFNGEYIVIAVTKDSSGNNIKFPIMVTFEKEGFQSDEVELLEKLKKPGGVIEHNHMMKHLLNRRRAMPWVPSLLLGD